MKLTKSKLKHIIREEIKYLFEVAVKDHEKDVPIDIAKKEGQEGAFIDLLSLVKLGVEAAGGEQSAEVKGIDMSAGSPQPKSWVVTVTPEPPKHFVSIGRGENRDKVFVPSGVFGQPFSISHPTHGEYQFIVRG